MLDEEPTALEIHAENMGGQSTGWGEITLTSGGSTVTSFPIGNTAMSVGWPYNPYSYPNQYVPPIGISSPMVYQNSFGTYELLTEERVRQIIHEELVAHFDEGKDVLAAPSPQEDADRALDQEMTRSNVIPSWENLLS